MSTVILKMLNISMCRAQALTRSQVLRPKLLGWVATLDYSLDQKKTFVRHKNVKQRELLHDMLQEKKERFKESGQILLKDIKETRDKVKEKMEEVIERENVLTIPNLLCISRIVISPFLGYLILQSNFHMALGVFVFAGISDLRTLSRYFDVTHATAQLSPTAISKWNTGMQLLLVATTLAAPVFDYVDHPVLHVMWYVTAGTTFASAMSYLISRNTYKFLKPKK
ncbi:hypothetical protein ANN_10198 [Periplaneta americana]|uniref:cardiolipin synthase (CMP-forming) n=1 Tax=Periplaneta americana TaxID=6978 RepID=A0ABQ8TS87_PERAM|nr:hypothetical protein ANN_10198 [Periplaneta americana]